MRRSAASLSPDGRTLLSVGDSPKVYLHHLSGGSRLTFNSITTLSLPPPDASSLYYSSSSLAASFSTSFSSNGTKFAVASQEGAVAVWDVRSSKPLKVFQTDQSRMPSSKSPTNGGATGWLSDDPWDWTRGAYRAPGWGVRSVKFGSDDSGREIMAFTEVTFSFY
jgi:WD40 repeat protein